MHTYPIGKEAKETELSTIKNILQNNEYNENIVEKPLHPKKEKTRRHPEPKNKMVHLHIQWNRSKENHKTFSRHGNKNSFPYEKHSTNHIKATHTNR
jgi:hypothetical protein